MRHLIRGVTRPKRRSNCSPITTSAKPGPDVIITIEPIFGVSSWKRFSEHSGGTKAAVILLTLLLLGPIMTFLYACFGTRSRVLRTSTLICFAVVLLSGGSLLVLAIAVPVVKEKLPWRTAPAENVENAAAAPMPGPAEVVGNSVDPEPCLPSPPFNWRAAEVGSGGWGSPSSSVLQFNAQGALLASIRLSSPIPVGRYPFPLAQLAFAENQLICIVSPSEQELDAGVATGCTIYLIEPRSGECRVVRSDQAKDAVSPVK